MQVGKIEKLAKLVLRLERRKMNVRQMAEARLEPLLQRAIARDNKMNVGVCGQAFGRFKDKMQRLLRADVSGVENDKRVVGQAKLAAECIWPGERLDY